MTRRVLAGLALVASTVALPVNPAQSAPAKKTASRYIIRFTDSTSDDQAQANVREDWALNTIDTPREYGRLRHVFNGSVATLTATEVAKLRRKPNVLWAEEDRPVSVNGTVVPPSWGLDRLDQRALPLDNTYSFPNDGSGVDVYVVDTGVFAPHNQFAGRIGQLPDNAFTSIADGNGTGDCSGHGTHVAGIAAGATFGVAPGARIIPVRVLDCTGSGSVSGVVSGIEWALTHHTNRPAVMNMSFATAQSSALESAVDRAYADGITVVAAAGNSSTDACTVSPAGAKVSALTVAATTSSDARASYSNFGACVDLFAPGSLITSADIASPSSSVVMSGTSMAAPHVTGLVARFLSSSPAATPAVAMAAVTADATLDVVTNPGALSPNRLAYANGAAGPSTSAPTTTGPAASTTTTPQSTTSVPPVSITTPVAVPAPSVPGAVSELSVVAGASSADLSWSAAPAGTLPTSSHIVRVYADDVLFATVVVDNDSVHVIDGLKPGVAYRFAVAAANGVGVGEFSAESPAVVPLRQTAVISVPKPSGSASVRPKSPSAVKAVRSGRHAVVTWTLPEGATATSFEVRFLRGKKTLARVVTGASGGVRVSGLPRGRYVVRVVARNAAGASAPSRSVSFSF